MEPNMDLNMDPNESDNESDTQSSIESSEALMREPAMNNGWHQITIVENGKLVCNLRESSVGRCPCDSLSDQSIKEYKKLLEQPLNNGRPFHPMTEQMEERMKIITQAAVHALENDYWLRYFKPKAEFVAKQFDPELRPQRRAGIMLSFADESVLQNILKTSTDPKEFPLDVNREGCETWDQVFQNMGEILKRCTFQSLMQLYPEVVPNDMFFVCVWNKEQVDPKSTRHIWKSTPAGYSLADIIKVIPGIDRSMSILTSWTPLESA